ncbi:hypothetical protein O181_069825 [Austropuccinia psidii MF-1]|uniref:P-type ATPase A domain-containing protein n=1 Tax=Austropuccinia psidii MF-1 TaxID=1389203 RepID=A0A9Q3I8G2_9BASI|nr:hypothetical protein [Austropuccinia psidii MF-1]
MSNKCYETKFTIGWALVRNSSGIQKMGQFLKNENKTALTGESLPAGEKFGDQCFSGSTCKQSEAKGVVIATGENILFGRASALVGADDNSSGHLQMIFAQIGMFGLVSIGIFIVIGSSIGVESMNLLVLVNGSITIAMPIVLFVTLAVGAQQLAKYKAIVIQITNIEELSGFRCLFSQKTGTLTTDVVVAKKKKEGMNN